MAGPWSRRRGSRLTAATVVLTLACLVIALPSPGLAIDAIPGSGRSLAQGGETPGFGVERILKGYELPLYVASDGADRLFIVEQPGRIRVARLVDGDWRKSGVFLNLRDRVAGPFVGRGLLGFAFHPGYATNGRFYVFYTRDSRTPGRHGDSVIAEYRRSSDLRAEPASHRTVLVIDQPSEYHFGGWLGFGPDGLLYVSTGYGGAAGVPTHEAARDLRSRAGKILRLDPTDPDGAGPARFTIPDDNPFLDRPRADGLIWAYGLRNPWRNSFDPETGDLWVADVGGEDYEEVNHLRGPDAGKGVDFGWYLCEGRHSLGTDDPCTIPGDTLPVVEYRHSGPAPRNCSVTGGYVYRGTAQPTLEGRYFFGDYCSGRIWAIPTTFDTGDGDALPAPLDTNLLITSLGEGAAGELYVVSRKGGIFELVED